MTRYHCLFVLKNAPHFLATRYTLPIFLCGKMVPNFLCGKMVKYTQTHCAVDYTQTHHTLAIRCSQGGACMAACIVQSCGGLYLVCMHVRMYTCTYAYMYVCIHVRMYTCTYVYMYVCIHVRVYTYVWRHVSSSLAAACT
jgi:hypothetical protein